MFVVGKNYRLQNIQLSKIRWGPSPQAPGSVARVPRLRSGRPELVEGRGPDAPLASSLEVAYSYSLKQSVYVGHRSARQAAYLHAVALRRAKQRSTSGADVGEGETQGASSLHRNFSKSASIYDARCLSLVLPPTLPSWLANRSSFDSACPPTSAPCATVGNLRVHS